MISSKKKIVGHCVGQLGEVHGPRDDDDEDGLLMSPEENTIA